MVPLLDQMYVLKIMHEDSVYIHHKHEYVLQVTASTDITPSKTTSDHLNHPTPTSPSSIQPKQQQKKKKQKMASDAPPSTPVDALQMHKIVDLTTTPLNQISAPKQEEKRLAAREHVEEFKKKYSNLVKFLMDEDDGH
mmetsp:Transcript_7644/g.15355  ORF Transcript_7644/g.15355 Transcript_7644/m.15355 type:complete len:138 (-) Transcript_7644:905-1318(-)